MKTVFRWLLRKIGIDFLTSEELAYFHTLYAYARRLYPKGSYADMPLFPQSALPNIADCFIEDYMRTKQLAEEAHICAVNNIPDSGIVAGKFDGAVVTNLPKK